MTGMLHDKLIVSDTWKNEKANMNAIRFTLAMWLLGAIAVVGNAPKALKRAY